ncbi:MAG: hypothetical protein MUC87_20295 [Bacteroidia bacterium]|jgi:hypothetical protein|nr:hypothetical protein [Bacteroidia bacterium]
MKAPVFFIFALSASLAFSACKKDTVPDPDPTTNNNSGGNNNNNNTLGGNTVRISLKNMVGNDSMIIGNAPIRYQNAAGDSFSIRMYKYYISNVKLTDNNGNTWSEPDSYHFVDAAFPATNTFDITGVPAGTYVSMTFLIGVDSARNVSGVQSGALDPSNGMFWTWSTGYIMAKLEGKAPNSPAAGDNIVFHIGGFSGANSGLRWATPSFGASQAVVTSTTGAQINMKSDALKWFTGGTNISFATVNNIMNPNANSVAIANNYASMFTVLSIQ